MDNNNEQNEKKYKKKIKIYTKKMRRTIFRRRLMKLLKLIKR